MKIFWHTLRAGWLLQVSGSFLHLSGPSNQLFKNSSSLLMLPYEYCFTQTCRLFDGYLPDWCHVDVDQKFGQKFGQSFGQKFGMQRSALDSEPFSSFFRTFFRSLTLAELFPNFELERFSNLFRIVTILLVSPVCLELHVTNVDIAGDKDIDLL